MDFGENQVEISPHGLARQPTKKRYLRKSRIPANGEEGDRQVRTLNLEHLQQQQQQPSERKLSGALVDELKLHFDFESLKED